jgi:hypothetical protein
LESGLKWYFIVGMRTLYLDYGESGSERTLSDRSSLSRSGHRTRVLLLVCLVILLTLGGLEFSQIARTNPRADGQVTTTDWAATQMILSRDGISDLRLVV